MYKISQEDKQKGGEADEKKERTHFYHSGNGFAVRHDGLRHSG